MKNIILILFIVLSVVCFTQCSSQGITVTNNPQNQDGGGDDVEILDSPSPTEANDIRTSLCNALDFCFSTVDESECLTGLDDDVNLLDVLDPNGSSADSFTEISELEESGDISYSQTSLQSCVSAIDALECDDFSTAGAYSNSFINDYTNVYRSLPSTCEEVLQAE